MARMPQVAKHPHSLIWLFYKKICGVFHLKLLLDANYASWLVDPCNISPNLIIWFTARFLLIRAEAFCFLLLLWLQQRLRISFISGRPDVLKNGLSLPAESFQSEMPCLYF